MTGRAGIDGLLDAYSRQTAKSAAFASNLWHSEWLLSRVVKILPELIAQSPRDAVLRDTLIQEVNEFLAEDRPHPGPELSDGEACGEAASPSDIDVA